MNSAAGTCLKCFDRGSRRSSRTAAAGVSLQERPEHHSSSQAKEMQGMMRQRSFERIVKRVAQVLILVTSATATYTLWAGASLWRWRPPRSSLVL